VSSTVGVVSGCAAIPTTACASTNAAARMVS
jgi:hypothetical protein